MITIEDLKERWFNAYPEVMGITGEKHIQCYGKKDAAGGLTTAKKNTRRNASIFFLELYAES